MNPVPTNARHAPHAIAPFADPDRRDPGYDITAPRPRHVVVRAVRAAVARAR